jgi:heptosyltransferase-1
MKLLIVKLSSYGDVVQALEALKGFSGHEVHWVIEKPLAPLVDGAVAHIHVADTKKWRKNPFKYAGEIKAFIKGLQESEYDAAVDLQGNLKSSLILPFVRARRKIGFGKRSVPEKINLWFTTERHDPPADQNIRLDYLFLLEKALGMKPVGVKAKLRGKLERIMICPGSAWPNKQVTPERLAHFLQPRIEKDAPQCFILWGNDKEKNEAETLAKLIPGSQLLPKLSLKELKETLLTMDWVVAMDSFPLHYAAYLGIPTFAFFGPSSAKKYAPIGPNSHYLQGGCPYGRTFQKRCPVLRTCPTGACLKQESFQDP